MIITDVKVWLVEAEMEKHPGIRTAKAGYYI